MQVATANLWIKACIILCPRPSHAMSVTQKGLGTHVTGSPHILRAEGGGCSLPHSAPQGVRCCSAQVILLGRVRCGLHSLHYLICSWLRIDTGRTARPLRLQMAPAMTANLNLLLSKLEAL